MQTTELVLVECAFVLCMILNVFGEPFTKFVVRIEQAGHDKVQKGPEFLHRVLHRRTGQEQTIPAVEAQERLPSVR